jgi:copper chaperone CopZ
MATVSDTFQVTGIRCERCVMRLAKTLEGHEGLESANANLMGQVMLQWDDGRTSRDEIVARMEQGGFRQTS